MSEPLLIAVLGGNTTLLVAVIGFLATYIRRNGKSSQKLPGWNGEERRKDQAARYYQDCPHITRFDDGVKTLRKEMTDGFKGLTNEIGKVHTRIDTLIQQERR